MGRDDSGSTPRSNKVARLLREYDLGSSFGDRLESLWTAADAERMSLRDLAALFNRRLLEEAMTDAGMSTVDGEVDNLYRILTDDDVSSGVRTEARARLEQNGVDVDALESDFVTYQAIRSYLKDYRHATYEATSDADRIESVGDTIRQLRSRLRAVTKGSLEQLGRTDRLTLGNIRLFVDVDVLCEDCGAQYGALELLERGGCDCDAEK